MTPTIETIVLQPNSLKPLRIPRIITGLWQLAGGHDSAVDVASCAKAMQELSESGFTGFDMADHYGPAEEVVGAYRSMGDGPIIQAFTKWCPAPGPTTREIAEAAVDLALKRMKSEVIDLLQYHIWDYTDMSYLANCEYLADMQKKGKIAHLGLTNTDLSHLKLLYSSGITIASNQVSISVLDRRAHKGGLAEWAEANGVGLLAYGTLLGGFISEKWVGKAEPTELDNWSLKKYKRFIDAAGGWEAFQTVLQALDTIAKKHGVSISTIASRYVLDLPGVAAVIVGSRLGPSAISYASLNLEIFSLKLDDTDRETIAVAQEGLKDLPGDCGDEYRRPPFLTAAGDLSDHISPEDKEKRESLDEAISQGRRVEYSSGSPWEPIAGYCRAVRIGQTITVSGTTARQLPSGGISGGSSAQDQTSNVLDIISGALKALGSSLKDVVRTRVFLVDETDCIDVCKVHGAVFAREGIRPANTCIAGIKLIGPTLRVEIEADAVVGAGAQSPYRI
ncbi:aldo/keto reductase [Naematelia encephala]|uniref:Aldo/keto reductase n=1 Tax=Naematelia encephala TaxID=71784 RepID=A0A1Y2BGD4_9TREE|nr:aldo/keto reductase [Naematelia encephala]